jgi:hypothetical protein
VQARASNEDGGEPALASGDDGGRDNTVQARASEEGGDQNDTV